MTDSQIDYKKFYDQTWRLEMSGDCEQFRVSPLRKFINRFEFHRYDLTEEMLGRWTGASGGALIDVGCGTGELMLRLHGRFREVTGVDVSMVALETARAKFAEKGVSQGVRFVEHGLDARLPFDTASFDAVVCNAVLEHVFDVYGLTSELARILKPNGCLILQVPNLAYLKHRVSLLFGRLPITSTYPSPELGWDGGHLHYFTKRTLLELLAWAGLQTQEVSGTGAFGRLRNWWPSLLCGDFMIVATRHA